MPGCCPETTSAALVQDNVKHCIPTGCPFLGSMAAQPWFGSLVQAVPVLSLATSGIPWTQSSYDGCPVATQHLA